MCQKILAGIIFGLTGCTAMQEQLGFDPVSANIDGAVAKYAEAAGRVRLGDSRSDVLALLEPTQKGVPAVHRKSPDKYFEGNSSVEIFYFRSGRSADGLTTDDEFTPYQFRDGKLVSIGWAALGGPKTVAGRTGAEPTPSSSPPPRTPGNNVLCRDAVARGDQGAMMVHCD